MRSSYGHGGGNQSLRVPSGQHTSGKRGTIDMSHLPGGATAPVRNSRTVAPFPLSPNAGNAEGLRQGNMTSHYPGSFKHYGVGSHNLSASQRV